MKKISTNLTILLLLLFLGIVLPMVSMDDSSNIIDNRKNFPIYDLQSSDVSLDFEQLYNLGLNITWGGINRDEGNNIKLNQSDIYLSGTTASFGGGNSDAVLIKMDEFGNIKWNTTWGGSEIETGRRIDFDSSNNIIQGGKTYSFGPSVPNANWFISKFDASGAQLMNRSWGTVEGEYGGGVVVDSTDYIYFAGCTFSQIGGSCTITLVKHNSSGDEEWTKYAGYRSGHRDITIDSSDNIYISGVAGGADEDAVFLKYTTDGILDLSRTWGGTGLERGWAIKIDSVGNIYIAGETSSYGVNIDAVLLKYNSSGDFQWYQTWGGDQFETAFALALDSQEDIYIAGETESFGDLDGDNFIVKYSSTGDQIWNYTWGGINEDVATDITLDSSDNLFLTGYTESYGAGDADLYLLKFEKSSSTVPPEIIINSPNQFEIFRATSPSFDVSITGTDIDTRWYTIDGGATNITFTGITGQISQVEWDKQGNGAVTLRFYVNNTLGFENFTEVIVIKDVVKQPPPGIPGYNLIALIGVTLTITTILSRRRIKK